MRLGASAVVGGREGAVEYPPSVFIDFEGVSGGPPRPSLTADRWLELRLK